MRTLLGTLLAALVVATLGITLLAVAPAGASTYRGDCIETPGHLKVRQVRDGDRLGVTLRATGMPHRRWSGSAHVLYGGMQSSGGQQDQFGVSTPRGRARHTSVLDVPNGFSSSGVMLTAATGQTRPSCSIDAAFARRSASVSMYHARFQATAYRGRVHLEYAGYTCQGDSTWRAEVVVRWRDHTITSGLGRDECLNGVVTLTRALPGKRLPRSVSLVARGDDGHVWRASYALG